MDSNTQKCPSSGSDPDTSTSAATTGMIKSQYCSVFNITLKPSIDIKILSYRKSQ